MRKQNNKERWCGHCDAGPTGNIYNPWENAIKIIGSPGILIENLKQQLSTVYLRNQLFLKSRDANFKQIEKA